MIHVYINIKSLGKKEFQIPNTLQAVWVSPDCKVLTIIDNTTKKENTFHFDFCFPPAHNTSRNPDGVLLGQQSNLYEQLGSRVLEGILQGFDTCVLCFGQAGGRKAGSLFGDPAGGVDRGFAPRLIRDLLAQRSAPEAAGPPPHLEMAMLAVGNEKARDLFLPLKLQRELSVCPRSPSGIDIQGLSFLRVTDPASAAVLLKSGIKDRNTKPGDRVSMAHIITILTITQQGRRHDQPASTTKVWLIDLAGAELNGKKGPAKPASLSLAALSRAVDALGTTAALDRGSILTKVLQEVLGGNCLTTVMATINPSASSYQESLQTLRCASRIRQLRDKIAASGKILDSPGCRSDSPPPPSRTHSDSGGEVGAFQLRMLPPVPPPPPGGETLSALPTLDTPGRADGDVATNPSDGEAPSHSGVQIHTAASESQPPASPALCGVAAALERRCAAQEERLAAQARRLGQLEREAVQGSRRLREVAEALQPLQGPPTSDAAWASLSTVALLLLQDQEAARPREEAAEARREAEWYKSLAKTLEAEGRELRAQFGRHSAELERRWACLEAAAAGEPEEARRLRGEVEGLRRASAAAAEAHAQAQEQWAALQQRTLAVGWELASVVHEEAAERRALEGQALAEANALLASSVQEEGRELPVPLSGRTRTEDLERDWTFIESVALSLAEEEAHRLREEVDRVRRAAEEAAAVARAQEEQDCKQMASLMQTVMELEWERSASEFAGVALREEGQRLQMEAEVAKQTAAMLAALLQAKTEHERELEERVSNQVLALERRCSAREAALAAAEAEAQWLRAELCRVQQKLLEETRLVQHHKAGAQEAARQAAELGQQRDASAARATELEAELCSVRDDMASLRAMTEQEATEHAALLQRKEEHELFLEVQLDRGRATLERERLAMRRELALRQAEIERLGREVNHLTRGLARHDLGAGPVRPPFPTLCQ